MSSGRFLIYGKRGAFELLCTASRATISCGRRRKAGAERGRDEAIGDSAIGGGMRFGARSLPFSSTGTLACATRCHMHRVRNSMRPKNALVRSLLEWRDL
jgi:hypothetical protein